MQMRTILRWATGPIFALVVAPSIGEFFVKWAEQNGIYDNSNGRLSVIMSAFTESPFYWPLFWTSGGALIWFLLDLVARKFQKTDDTGPMTAPSGAKSALLELRFKNYPKMPSQTKNENVFSWFVNRHDLVFQMEDGSQETRQHTYIVVFFDEDFWPSFTDCDIVGKFTPTVEIKHRDQKGLLVSISGTLEDCILTIRAF